MTRWRAVFLRARLIPFVISLAVVLVGEALQLGTLLAWIIGSVGLAAVLTRTMWVWRLIGVRRPTATDLELLRGAVGQVPDLRGRREPRLWLGPGQRIQLRAGRDLIVGRDWIQHLSQGGDVDQAAAHIAAAAALSRTLGKTWVVAVDLLTGPGRLALLPWKLFAPIKGWMYAQLVLLVVVGSVQQISAGRWPVAVGLVLLAAASIAHPIWAARWERERCLLVAPAR